MSYQYEIVPNEDLDSDKFPMSGRLTPIGSASSDTEYDKRFFIIRFSNKTFIYYFLVIMKIMHSLKNMINYLLHLLH